MTDRIHVPNPGQSEQQNSKIFYIHQGGADPNQVDIAPR
jgi:hypothetical protein